MVFLLFHKADGLLRFAEGRPFLLFATAYVAGFGERAIVEVLVRFERQSCQTNFQSRSAGVVENLKSSSRFVTSRSELGCQAGICDTATRALRLPPSQRVITAACLSSISYVQPYGGEVSFAISS